MDFSPNATPALQQQFSCWTKHALTQQRRLGDLRLLQLTALFTGLHALPTTGGLGTLLLLISAPEQSPSEARSTGMSFLCPILGWAHDFPGFSSSLPGFVLWGQAPSCYLSFLLTCLQWLLFLRFVGDLGKHVCYATELISIPFLNGCHEKYFFDTI